MAADEPEQLTVAVPESPTQEGGATASLPEPPLTPDLARTRSKDLSGLGSPDLRAKAKELGIDEDKIASLKDDEHDTNAELVSMILQKLQDPAAPLPYTGQRVLSRDGSWAEAVRAGGLSTGGALLWAVVRLVWHLGPPILFIATSFSFSACAQEDDPTRRMLQLAGSGDGSAAEAPSAGPAAPSRRSTDSVVSGGIAYVVIAWWAISVLCTLVCVCANPSFLLVDLRASFRDGYFHAAGRKDATGGYFFCMIYVWETEMYVVSAINAKLRLSERWLCRCTETSWYGYFMSLGVVLQIVGVLLFTGIMMEDLPPACGAWQRVVLCVGYGLCIFGVLFKMIHVNYSCYGNAHGDKSIDHSGIPGSPISGAAHGAAAALSPCAPASFPPILAQRLRERLRAGGVRVCSRATWLSSSTR